jgi:hypothetical protein
MQHTNSSYVLNDVKFKKVSKGLKLAIQKKMGADAANLSLQFIMQSLSKELFSIPYEEAKSTILVNGQASILAGATHQESIDKFFDTPIEREIIDKQASNKPNETSWGDVVEGYKEHPVCKGMDEHELISLLSGVFMALELDDTGVGRRVMQISKCLEVGEFVGKTTMPHLKHSILYRNQAVRRKTLPFLYNRGGWEGRASSVFKSLMSCLVERHESTCVAGEYLDLKEVLNVLTLDDFASVALDEIISIRHRAGLHNLLKSVNYTWPTKEIPNPVQRQSTIEHFQYVTMTFESDVMSMLKLHKFIVALMKK